MAVDPKPVRRARTHNASRPRGHPLQRRGYAFALKTERKLIDPCHEFRHLQVRAGCCSPNVRRSTASRCPCRRRSSGRSTPSDMPAMPVSRKRHLPMLIDGHLKIIGDGGGFRNRAHALELSSATSM